MRSITGPSRRLHPLVSVLGAALLAATAAGCAPREPTYTGSIDVDGYRTRHPIVVEEGEETLDVPVALHSARLPVSLVAAVESFGAEARKNGASGIVMMVPNGSTNEVAAHRVSRELTAALGRAGIAAHAITRRTYEAMGPEDAAPIRLSYPRIVAHVPHQCGRWPRQATSDWDNADYWNFGCATQSNLAAMVANPTDLVAPSGLGQPDATRRSTVLQAYRSGKATKSEYGLPSPGLSSVGGGQ